MLIAISDTDKKKQKHKTRIEKLLFFNTSNFVRQTTNQCICFGLSSNNASKDKA